MHVICITASSLPAPLRRAGQRLRRLPDHQTGVRSPTPSGDLNHYDRYFFNGYTTDGSLYFLGVKACIQTVG
jgi:hypothetical protein